MSVHHCEAQGCGKRTAPGLLMDGRHWRMVPPMIQKQVYATWKNGAGAGSPEHEAAKQRAIAAVAQLEGRAA